MSLSVLLTEKSVYDASGSSPFPNDPTVAGSPAHSLARLSVAQEAVHSNDDSRSKDEGLSGKPAFSSVLTVMAGTAKHQAVPDQSRTLPTISREETHTTQWPSHSSSQGLELSSSSSPSSSYLEDRIPQTSSGLFFSLSQKRTSSSKDVGATVARPSHMSLTEEGKNLSLFPFLSLPSMSSPAPSITPVSPSLASLFFLSSSTEWINKVASSQGQVIVSKAAHHAEKTLSPAEPQAWTGSLTTAKPTSHSVDDLHAVTQERHNATSKPFNFPSEASTEKSNKMTKYSFYSSDIYKRSGGTNAVSAPETSTYATTSYNFLNLLDNLYRPTQNQNTSIKSVSANNLEISPSVPSNQGSQTATQNPSSALLSAHPKGYSVSSHATQQMLHHTAYIRKEDKAAVDRHILVHKSIPVVSPLTSQVVNPTVTPAMTFTPSKLFFTVSSESAADQTSLSQTAVTKPTRIRFGIVSSENASNPADLLMAVGYSSPQLPAININHREGEITGKELRSASAQAHLSNLPSHTLLRTESSNVSVLSSSRRVEVVAVSTSESDLLRDAQDVGTKSGHFKGVTDRGWEDLKMIFTPDSRVTSPSEPAEFAKYMTYKTKHQSSSLFTQPTYLSLSNNSSHDVTDDSNEMYVESDFNSGPQIFPSSRPSPTRPLLNHPLVFQTTPFTKTFEQTVASSAKTSAYIKSKGTTEVQKTRGNYGMANMSQGSESFGPLHKNTAQSYVPPLFNRNQESALIIDSSAYKTDQLTTHLPSFMASEGFFIKSKGSGKKTSTQTPSFPVTAMESVTSPSHTADATFTGHHEQSSLSFWSDIIPTRRKSSVSLGPIARVSNVNTNSVSGRQTTVASSAPSAATSSFNDRQNSMETSSTISSFGTKLMALFSKWKTTKPMPLQSGPFESENASTSFDRAKYNFPADGSSYEHQKLEDRQERDVQILNPKDSTAVTSDSYQTLGEFPSFTFVKGTSVHQQQSLELSPAYLRSAVTVNVLPGVTKNAAATSAWGSDASLHPSYITTDSETSSQATDLAVKHGPSQSDFLSPESAFDSRDTLPENIKTNTVMKRSDLVLSLSSFDSSSSSVTLSSPSSSSSLLMTKPTIPMSFLLLNSDDISSGTTSISVSVKPTFSSPLPNVTLSLDSGHSQEVTQVFALAETKTDELSAGTSKSVVLTFPKEKEASLAPSQSDRITYSAGSTEGASQVSPLTPQQDTTTASAKITTTAVASTLKDPTTTTPSVRVTTQSTTTTTPQPTLTTRRTTTTIIKTQSNRRTLTPPFSRTSPPRVVTTVFISPFTTTTEAPPQQCNITERLWVKTGKENSL